MEDAQFLAKLHDIIRKQDKEDYRAVIEREASYPYLYHLSEIRKNLVDWIPMKEGARVLECCPECGALTGKLLEKAESVSLSGRGRGARRDHPGALQGRREPAAYLYR